MYLNLQINSLTFVFFSFFLLLIPSEIKAQEKFTLSGYVRDESNGEELIGVTIKVDSTNQGTVTNMYGFYSISLPKGEYEIEYTYIGYEKYVEYFNLNQNISKNINLNPESLQMDEVIITGKSDNANVTDVGMSKNELNITQVKRLPALFGEPDIIKTIQMLPGVISAGEGTSSFYVRGGSSDQNLILIDEAPIYDPSHLFGLFSVFNADVIKNSELYKGGIPSRYGGRLSSILDVRTRDGNNKNFEGSGGIGSLASRLTLEGPIKKDKSSYLISGRRSYVDTFLKLAGEKNLVYFYDINAKVNFRKNDNNRFFLAIYAGRDDFSFEDIFSFGWGNKTATFRWNHLFSEKLFSNTTLIASNFDYKLGLNDPSQGFEWTSDIKEFTIKQDFSWYPTLSTQIEFGFQSSGKIFSPGKIAPSSSSSIFTKYELDKLYALDHALYGEVKHTFSSNFDILLGLRMPFFQNIGPSKVFLYENTQNNVDIKRTGELNYAPWETIKLFTGIEPRLAARFMLSPLNSLKVSYNRMYQNTHLIASGTVPLPFNTWQPSSYYLKPQQADQIAGGYFRNTLSNTYAFSLELYYKHMKNITGFADNAQLFFNEDLATEFRQGTSTGYGLETMVEKKKGKLTGFVSYTLSKSTMKIQGVNLDREFPSNHDRRHNFNILATYEFNEKWIFGGGFTYGTGRPISIPAAQYQIEGYYTPTYYTARNGYRLPDFHRLDLSATLTPRKNTKRKIERFWVFSIYNVYNRKNPFSIYTQTKEIVDGQSITYEKEARMIYLFPILPSVTYNIKF